MIRIDLTLAEQPFSLMVSGQKIVQVFHAQQAITFDNPRENYYQFTYDNKKIGIDTGAIEEQSISLFVDDQFASTTLITLALLKSLKPNAASRKKPFLGDPFVGAGNASCVAN